MKYVCESCQGVVVQDDWYGTQEFYHTCTGENKIWEVCLSCSGTIQITVAVDGTVYSPGHCGSLGRILEPVEEPKKDTISQVPKTMKSVPQLMDEFFARHPYPPMVITGIGERDEQGQGQVTQAGTVPMIRTETGSDHGVIGPGELSDVGELGDQEDIGPPGYGEGV